MPKRRRGSQARRLPHHRIGPGSGAGRHSRFEVLVERALDSIPMPFAGALDEVAIVIEDEPSRQQLRENGLTPADTLYGLYEGVPRTEWGADWVPIPNKISLFRLPLEEDFPDPLDLEDEVRVTVIHELAHHLGIDDSRLDELGLD
jgi:predicted Zn-dependent protease with MMP-like domain